MAPPPAQAAGEPNGNGAPVDKATARRQKKREQDRKAQRVARERKNNRIAHLEALVDRLSQDNADSEVPVLMDRLATVTKQSHSLLEVLRSLESTIHRHIEQATVTSPKVLPAPSETGMDVETSSSNGSAKGHAPHRASEPGPPSVPTPGAPWASSPENDHQLGDDMSAPPGSNPWDSFAGPYYDVPFDDVSQYRPPIPELVPSEPDTASTTADVIVPLPPTTDCPCLIGSHQPLGTRRPPGFNTWRAANEALGKASTPLRPEDAVREDSTSHDTPIRAVLEGWDSVEAAGLMTDSWRKLRLVDEICFIKCGKIERVAILRMMHLMMTYHGDPTPGRLSSLPRWFWMRPSQALAHSYAIDYFVWPGVRERFVFSQHRYCTNLFWQLFQSNFKVTWQYGFRDCYMRDRLTGKFSLSPMFEQTISNIRAWTMDTDFFTHFPELCQDIPRVEGLPIAVGSARKDAQQVWEETQHHAVVRAARPFVGPMLVSDMSNDQVDGAGLYDGAPLTFALHTR
ncbi:hypothetical protein VD0004_g3666 [Verticillium dahliae]|nr:hypothetical protein VD0004_g3666 [Verticillium dahliae]PNH73222.1 hypothetical protein VD0001_g4300 [Verticillium dahliae]